MNISADALRELHRIHRQLTDLRDRFERGPKQVAAVDANVKKMELELEQAKDAAKKTRILADQKQLQLKGREDKIKELKGKLNQATSNREFQALKEQIAADEQANSVLSDEILEALEKMDQLQIVVKSTDDNLKKSPRGGGKSQTECRSRTGDRGKRTGTSPRELVGSRNQIAPRHQSRNTIELPKLAAKVRWLKSMAKSAETAFKRSRRRR